MRLTMTLITSAIPFMLGVPHPAAAGFWDDLLDKLMGKAEQKVEQRIDQRMDEAVEKAINKTEEGIKCVATDQACIRKAKEEGKNVVLTDTTGQVIPEGAGTSTPATPQSTGPQ